MFSPRKAKKPPPAIAEDEDPPPPPPPPPKPNAFKKSATAMKANAKLQRLNPVTYAKTAEREYRAARAALARREAELKQCEKRVANKQLAYEYQERELAWHLQSLRAELADARDHGAKKHEEDVMDLVDDADARAKQLKKLRAPGGCPAVEALTARIEELNVEIVNLTKSAEKWKDVWEERGGEVSSEEEEEEVKEEEAAEAPAPAKPRTPERAPPRAPSGEKENKREQQAASKKKKSSKMTPQKSPPKRNEAQIRAIVARMQNRDGPKKSLWRKGAYEGHKPIPTRGGVPIKPRESTKQKNESGACVVM